MWECVKCREAVEETFDACWNCGTSREGVEDPNFRKADDVLAEELPSAADVEVNPISCTRCGKGLDYVGTKSFHEGTKWGALGSVGELFVNRENFDVYCCPRCGRVEFFVDGIGEEFRSR